MRRFYFIFPDPTNNFIKFKSNKPNIMKKEVILLLGLLLVIYGCDTDVVSEKTAEERLKEGDYEDTITDYKVPEDYGSVERNINVLLEAGNTIGAMHYDELEASVNSLEETGVDVKALRDKLAQLNVAPRTENDDEYRPENIYLPGTSEGDSLDERFKETKRMITVISTELDGMSSEEYNKLTDELNDYEKEGLDIEDYRETLNSILIWGTAEHEAELQKKFPKVKQGLLSPNGCEGNGSFKLGTSPMRLEDLDRILPQGGMSTSHITPTDHQYWNTLGSSGKQDETTNLDRFDIIAPADGYIVDVEFKEDHRVVIEHSCDFYTIFIHVDLLKDHIISQIKDQVGEIGAHEWPKVKVKEGEVFGSIGVGKVDFSVIDANVILPGFVNPSAYSEKWKIHTVDTFDYFEEPIRSELLKKNIRTVEPFGGKIDYDIDGKLVGNWFLEGIYSGTENEDYSKGHLSIVYDSIDPDHIVVSIGEFNDRAVQYGVKGNTPDPKDVGVGELIEYELVPYDHYLGNKKMDESEFTTGLKAKNSNEVRGVALFELIDNKNLKVEFFPDKKDSQVGGFTSKAVVYER